MKMLREAEAGDILSRFGDDELEHYQFFGKGKSLLGGLARVSKPALNPEWIGGFGELSEIFANRNNGVGAIHFTDGGNYIKVLAEMGKLSYSIRVLDAYDINHRNSIIGFLGGICFYSASPLVAAVIGLAISETSPLYAHIPGMSVGDSYLTIGTAEYVPKYTIRWGFEYTLRDGNVLSSDGYYQQVPEYTPPPVGP